MSAEVQSILNRLSESQLPAAMDEGHTVMVAGPGSGKTTTMVAKAAYLAEKYGPETVAMLTFTRNAAKEMQDRLSAAIGHKAASSVHISTLHVAMGEIVSSVKAWRKRKRLSPGESTSMIYKALDEAFGARLDRGRQQRCLNAFNLIRSRYPLPDAPEDESEESVVAYMAVCSYTKSLRELNLIDYDSMLKDSVEALESGLAKPMNRRFLIVDEYQDTDETQHEWVKIHARHGVMTTIVGDDDQSIYAFRGSIGYKSMKDFMESFPHHRYNVTTTYRTAPLIMSAATNMIGLNNQRLQKDIRSGVTSCNGTVELRVYSPDGIVVESRLAPDLSGFYQIDSGDALTKDVVSHEDDDGSGDAGGAAYQESAAAVDYISSLMQFEGGVGAILARTNFSLGMLEARARQLGVPYYRSGSGVFLDKPHIAEAVSLVSMGFDLPTKKSLSMALSLYQVSPAGIDRALEAMGRCEVSGDPFSFLLDTDLFASLDTVDDATKIRAFRDMITDWRDLVLTRGKCLTKDMVQDIQEGLDNVFSDLSIFQTDKGKRIKELKFFFSFLSEKVDGSVHDRVRAVSRIFGRDVSGSNNVDGKLYFGTLHSAKGMEFDYVWIMRCDAWGVSDEIDYVSSVEEGRRLFYVGMTRAKTRLFFSAIGNKKEYSLVRYIDECFSATAH